MESYKIEFIKFALSRNVLKFGEFALKSGRKSPYQRPADPECGSPELAYW